MACLIAWKRWPLISGKYVPSLYIDQINAAGREFLSKRIGLIRRDSGCSEILRTNAVEKWLLCRPDRSYGLDDLERKAHAVLERSAIMVGPRIGDRRQKLVQEVSVCGMNLERVETSRKGANSGGAEIVDPPWISASEASAGAPSTSS